MLILSSGAVNIIFLAITVIQLHPPPRPRLQCGAREEHPGGQSVTRKVEGGLEALLRIHGNQGTLQHRVPGQISKGPHQGSCPDLPAVWTITASGLEG